MDILVAYIKISENPGFIVARFKIDYRYPALSNFYSANVSTENKSDMEDKSNIILRCR